jgi:hypothetical protein
MVWYVPYAIRVGNTTWYYYYSQDFDFAAKRTPLVQLELVTSLSGLFDEKYLAKTLVKSKGQYLDS